MKEINDCAAKRRYEQPRLSRVLLIPQEEMLLPGSWNDGHNEQNMNIIEDNPEDDPTNPGGYGKGAKTNGRFWDDSDEY